MEREYIARKAREQAKALGHSMGKFEFSQWSGAVHTVSPFHYTGDAFCRRCGAGVHIGTAAEKQIEGAAYTDPCRGVRL